MTMKNTYTQNFVFLLLFSITLLLPILAFAQGTFDGTVQTEWLTDAPHERKMVLLKDFAFIDQANVRWQVPKGFTIDGASIPPTLWSLAGSPYTGNYRRAAVVHDYYCVTRTKSWQSVHLMFYEAMIAGGVDKIKAKIMYQVVYARGPRWVAIESSHLQESGKQIVITQTPHISPVFEAQVREWIKSSDPSLDEISRRLDKGISVTVAE